MPRSALFLLLLSSSALAFTDLKIRTVSHFHNESSPSPGFNDDRTEYVQGTNRRTEMQGFVGISSADPNTPKPHMALIARCDSHKRFEINLDTQEYVEEKLPRYPTEKEYRQRVAEAKKKSAEQPPQPALPPNLLVESNTVDTGETQVLFGHTARHVITTIKETPLTGLDRESHESVTDGWYIDIPQPQYDCRPEYMTTPKTSTAVSVLTFSVRTASDQLPNVRPKVHHTGPVVVGFPVRLRITGKTLDKTGVERSSVSETEVVELSEEQLSPSLFEVPAGFKKVSRLYQHSVNAAGK